MTLDSILTFEEAVKMYRVVTGGCEAGVRSFVSGREVKEHYTVAEIIELTQGQYGNESLIEFIKGE